VGCGGLGGLRSSRQRRRFCSLCGVILPRSRRRWKSVRVVLRISPWSLSVSCIKPPAMLPSGPPSAHLWTSLNDMRARHVRDPYATVCLGGPSSPFGSAPSGVADFPFCRRSDPSAPHPSRCGGDVGGRVVGPAPPPRAAPGPLHGARALPPLLATLLPTVLHTPRLRVPASPLVCFEAPLERYGTLTFGFPQGAVAAGLAGHLGAAALGGVAAV
jgi:hypothetical protein